MQSNSITRFDVIDRIDNACKELEMAAELLNAMGVSFAMPDLIGSIVRRLEDIRVDVYSADLPNEQA